MSASPTLAIEKQLVSVQESARVLEIRSADDYVRAGEISKSISYLRKEVEATFNPIIAKAHEAHKEACEQKKKHMLPLDIAQNRVDRLLLAWQSEQEAIRRAEEDRLATIAKKEADDRAMAEAEELQRQGESHLADVVIETQATAPAPVVSIPSSVPKVQGFAKRVNWRWRVKNVALIPREYMQPNEIAIGGVVRSLKDKTQIAGVEVYPEDSAIHR